MPRRDRSVRLWEAETGKLVITVGHEAHVASVVFSPDGARSVSASSDGAVLVWETATGRRLLSLRAGEEPVHLNFSRDGGRI